MHNPSVQTALESTPQLSLIPPDGSPISQMISIGGAQIGAGPLAVNSTMMHGLVANSAQVHNQTMMHNGGHLYSTGEEYQHTQLAQHYQPTHHVSQHSSNSTQPQTQTSQPTAQQPTPPQSNKKRKVSDVQGNKLIHNGTTTNTGSTSIYIKQEPTSLSPDSALHSSNGNNSCTSSNNGSNVHSTQQCEDEYFDYGPDSQMYADSFYQCIRFTPFNPTSSCLLYDANIKEM